LVRTGRLRISVQTSQLHAQWASFCGPEGIDLIPLASEPGHLVAADKARARAALGLADAEPLVAVLGALTPAKGYIELMRAYEDRDKPFSLLLAGDWADWEPPDPREVARQTGWAERTTFWMRYITEADFERILAAADVIALLYRNPDASSGILSRCREAGTPVLVPNRGYLAEVVEQHGGGQTADPHDGASVRAAVERLLTGRAARGTAPQGTSWMEMARQHLHAFRAA
jgi:glycosyltransferase involved in cell wall biosynthesis